MNIKYILWLYSSGEFSYSQRTNPFSDNGIRYCINESAEIWVWNHLTKKLFKDRMLIEEDIDKIKVIGPILNGNWNLLKNSNHLKEKKFTLAVFDITPMKAEWRLNYGTGPFCNSDLQEKFYQGIYKIYESFPDLKIIIKTKRFHSQIYDFSPTLKKLQDLKSDRIVFPSTNANPYQVLSDADMVLSIPFTSPTMMALSFGINAAYYDPINLCNHSYLDAFQHLTLKTEDDLLNFIKNYKNDVTDTTFSRFTIHEIEKSLKKYLH